MHTIGIKGLLNNAEKRLVGKGCLLVLALVLLF